MADPLLDDDRGVKSIGITLRILEYLAHQSAPAGVTAVANALGVNKSRTFRHLQTLMQYGYVSRSPKTELYQAGMRLVTLGRAVADRLSLAGLGRDAITALRDRLGHSVVLSQLDPEGLRAVASVSGTSFVEIGIRQGSILSYHATAQGKLALAFGPPDLCDQVLASPLSAMTDQTIVGFADLMREIELIRLRGWSVAPNEGLVGLNALAAPIFDAFGAMAGTVAIVDMVQFVAAVPTAAQIAAVIETARTIRIALGGQPSLVGDDMERLTPS